MRSNILELIVSCCVIGGRSSDQIYYYSLVHVSKSEKID
jgi:hypothetical protein